MHNYRNKFIKLLFQSLIELVEAQQIASNGEPTTIIGVALSLTKFNKRPGGENTMTLQE